MGINKKALWWLLVAFVTGPILLAQTTNGKIAGTGIQDLPAKQKCVFTRPDTSVYHINLEDEESTEKQLGSNLSLTEDHSYSLPYISFNSADKKQVLTLLFHYGGTRNAFAEFEVKQHKTPNKNRILPVREFATNSGIKLGMPKGKVIQRLGNCFTITKIAAKEVLRYTIRNYMVDTSKSEFLKRYNMPEYYAQYEFEKGKLTRYQFGFEYP